MPDKGLRLIWQVAANLTDDAPASPFQHHKFIIRGDGGAVAENLLSLWK